jgi:hypothetical protein
MRAIMADNDLVGHVGEIVRVLLSDEWREIWLGLHLEVQTFADLSLKTDASDADVWNVCQEEQVILITGNRNKKGPDSLEATIQIHNTSNSLPVLTISDPNRVLRSRTYLDEVVVSLLDYLLFIDNVRGAGRLWLP